ncbi:sigma-70 family RNA polymerase sigma factor [Zavarzinella formosa]|uniref:hypothetical protein n=1 Tax=Zavarzinella formosa TaxID=360055 RepID=UPI00037B62D1|nr:hypothetical protein [Zavarzinella formosa]
MQAPPNIKAIHERFLAVLPKIEEVGHHHFRYWGKEKCAEAVQEMTAQAWKSYLSADLQGKEPDSFICVLAKRCCQHVKAGRRAAGGFMSTDVSDRTNQLRAGFKVAQEPEDGLSPMDTVVDNRHSSPADCAAFKTDMRTWLERMTPKKRAIVTDMMTGEDTSTLAEKHAVSRGRISQIRRECKEELEPGGRS